MTNGAGQHGDMLPFRVVHPHMQPLAALFAVGSGFLALRYRLKGAYFALATFAFAEMFRLLATNSDFVNRAEGYHVPLQVDEQPPPLRRAPEHGEHTEVVLLELGYSWDEISELNDAGVIP